MRRILTILAILPTFVISVNSSKDPLLFPQDSFTVETKTVKTSKGEKKVTCRSYMHIPYVASPVDKDYESLNVSIPVKIDGADVDATNAPILFNIGVGGYMSSSNAGAGRGGGMGGPRGGDSGLSGKTDLALAAGYVVVSPGCRGRDNKAADGTYYGKAPAARYPRFSGRPVTAPCTMHILKRSALPMRMTTSMPAPASAPSRTWSMPTWPMNGCMAPSPSDPAAWWIKGSPNGCKPFLPGIRPL
jgi:hypothetical protein